MPAFTYVASIIVAEIVTIGIAAAIGSAGVAFVTSVIATGLAYATAQLISGGSAGGGGGTSQDPGVRIQFPPATNNKVPVIYGSAYQKGVVTDARISNENKTMTYVMVLSEKTQTGTFTIGDIYWNDAKLVFDAAGADSHIVRSSVDQNGLGDSSTNFSGLIRMRIYAGNVDAASQIFPPQATGNTVNARTLLAEADTNYQLNGLVFAVIQVDYSSEKGTTGLGQITYQVNNTLKNPGLVWYDYITSQRYGAGIDTSQVDSINSISTATTSLYTLSNTIPANQFETGGTTATNQVRYEINGVISTGESVRNNLEKINRACASWTSYDVSQGKWKIIPNRAANNTELTNALVFNDDNILGDVGLTSTNLEDLYNILEVEFPSRTQRDQNDYYRAEIDAEQRNDLEPNNILNMRFDLCNNAIHAARIGLIELKQSRIDLIITFLADYSATQVEAGDVIKVTNSVYGFSEKLFRVTKTREVEDDSGSLTVEITALQYDSGVYSDESLSDFAASTASGIPSFGGSTSLPPPSAPTLSSSNPSAAVPNFTISTVVNATSGPVNLIEWFYASSAGGTYRYLTNERSSTGNFGAGSTVTDVITGLGAGTWYFKARTSNGSLYSDFSSASASFTWSPSATGGSSTTSTYADQVLTSAVSTGEYNVALVDGLNDYYAINGDSGLTFDAATNELTAGKLNTTNMINTGAAGTTYAIDRSGSAAAYANAATLNFANFSGMIVINRQDAGSGNVALWLCGGSAAVKIGDSHGNESGSIANNGGISGYTWTNDTGGTVTCSFTAIRTRAGN
jgi:hypothetical protein